MEGAWNTGVRGGGSMELEEGECNWRAETEGFVLKGEVGAWQVKAKRHIKYFCESNGKHLCGSSSRS